MNVIINAILYSVFSDRDCKLDRKILLSVNVNAKMTATVIVMNKKVNVNSMSSRVSRFSQHILIIEMKVDNCIINNVY